MDLSTIKNTKICNESNSDFSEHWFSRKQKKFISHVDTLYFTVFPDCEDWNNDSRKVIFLETLRNVKRIAEVERLPQHIFEDVDSELMIQPFFGAQMYSYHFGVRDEFDFFVCEFTPNVNTPPIMVQIRSNILWLDGLKNAFDKACGVLETVLGGYGLHIKRVQENRIDYAYHTNYIQDLLNFLPERDLKEMQISNFMVGDKRFYFNQDKVFSDYFTLGRRMSNNVFYRMYNKSKEVVELGYKQFFIAMWLDKGLISKFDEFVLRSMFYSGSWVSKDKARCKFYTIYGKDFDVKQSINQMLLNPDTPNKAFTKIADGLVPDLTVVTNVEFETKRKFYDRLFRDDDGADGSGVGKVKNYPEEEYREYMYDMFRQMTSFADFLTDKTIRFIKYKGKYADIDRDERPNADWWQRLRSCKPLEYADEEKIKYFREYQNRLDFERMKTLSINKMASFAAYSGVDESLTMQDDVNNFLFSLNDNDIHKYYMKRDENARKVNRRLGRS